MKLRPSLSPRRVKVSLVPYLVVAVIPMSPPVHTVAFMSMANAGILPPSAFTRRRQDVGRFYEAALPRRAASSPASSGGAASRARRG